MSRISRDDPTAGSRRPRALALGAASHRTFAMERSLEVDGSLARLAAARVPRVPRWIGGLLLLGVLWGGAHAQVRSHVEIGSSNGMAGLLGDRSMFGASVASVGDLDGDGQAELAVGTPGTLAGGSVWMLFPRADASLKTRREISAETGGFSGRELGGASLAALGDLDGDGTPDLAVGAPEDPFGGSVWILFLTPQGTVRSDLQIGASFGGFPGTLLPSDRFGASLARVGDLDGDGIPELAVGADGDCAPGAGCGAVWILFLEADGTVRAAQEVSGTAGGLVGPLGPSDHFGSAVAGLGDLAGDGTLELAVGALGDPTVSTAAGAVWILSLSPTGAVVAERKVTTGLAGFTGTLFLGDFFGAAVAGPGDVDGNGVPDLVVGAPGDDAIVPGSGALWMLFLEADGSVRGSAEIDDAAGAFGLLAGDAFGASVATVDRDGDGAVDLVAGAPFRDAPGPFPGPNRGSVWTLFLQPSVASTTVVRAGGNVVGFSQLTTPAIGRSWETQVDLATPGHPVSLVAIGTGPTMLPTPYGNLLIDLAQGLVGGAVQLATGTHAVPIPNDPALLGATLSAQGASAAPGVLVLNNALDVKLGTY